MLLTANVALTEQEQQTLQAIAQQAGTTQEELLRKAVQRLIAEFQPPHAAYQPLRMKRKRRQRSEAAKQRARERFEHHFGALNLGYATGVDNEQIDADLAQAYLATHEEN
jgi:hypothetical protein